MASQDSIANDRNWLAGLITGSSAVDSDRDIDVIFVRGIHQHHRCPDVTVGGSEIEPQVFAYSADAITDPSGLDDLAHRLLLDVQRLRTRNGSETDGPIVFVSHDYGGTIVKRALVMASRSKSFVKLLMCTWTLAFLGCPQRWDRAGDLEDKFANLLKAKPEAHVAGVTRLASIMAETTRATNEELIGANFLARVSLWAKYSDHQDDSLRIFDRADVCFLSSCETHSPTRLSHEELVYTDVDLGYHQHGLFKNAQREALLRMSSPVYPPTTRIPDRSQLDRLAGEASFQSFRQRKTGISVLEVFGHGDVRTAAEYIFSHLDHADAACSEERDGTPDVQRKFVQFFQFNSQDTRFRDIGCMLRTMIAQVAKTASQRSTISAIHDRMEELADNSATWTDGELYDFWIHLVRAIETSRVWLVLACFDECDASSRGWFLSRLSSSMAATELSLKLIVTHNRTDSGDELRMALSDLNSGALYQKPAPRQDMAEPVFPVLYSVDLYKIGFTASTSQYERPSTPLIVRDSKLYPQSADLWPRLGEMAEAQDALAIWIESNRKHAEQMVATLQQQLPSLSFVSVCRAILDVIPVKEQPWAREVMQWLGLTFRPLTVEEAAAAVGSGVFNKPSSGRDFVSALRKHFGGLFHIIHGEVRGGPKLWQAVKSAAGESDTEVTWYNRAEDSLGHREISITCLKYLDRREIQDALKKLGAPSGIRVEDAQDETETDLRLLAYATINWPLHCEEAMSLKGLTASVSTVPASVAAFLYHDELRDRWARAYHNMTRGPVEKTDTETRCSLQVYARLGFGHNLGGFNGETGKVRWQQQAMEAAAHGQIDTLRSILTIEPGADAKFDPDKASRVAMSFSNEEVILEILDRLPAQVDDSPSAWVSDLLLQSSRLGFTSVVKKLLDPPWNASHSAASGTLQPLHYAARGDHLDIAKLLKNAGADVEGTVHDGHEPPLSPLTTACKHASPNVAKFLLECGARTDITAGDRGWTPLQFAAASGCHLAINSILGYDKLDRYDSGREHPVALAMDRGYWRCVEALCRMAGDFEMIYHEKTLLSHAVDNGDVDMACMLLGRGAQLLGQHTDAQEALLHKAVGQNNKQMVALLIDKGADVNEESGSCRTPLAQAASLGSTDMAEYLLKRGAEVDKHDSLGRTPAYQASYYGRTKTLELLLQKNADPEGNITSNDGVRPIHVAYDSAEITSALLRHGADCNTTSSWGAPLLTAARHDYPETVKALLNNDIDGRRDGCNLEVEDEVGCTALTLALEGGKEEIVLALLDAGANVNRIMEVDSTAGGSPLHLAVRLGSEAMVDTMLRCRADVDAQDAAGNTPLNKIQDNTPVKIVRSLLCAGADIESTNDRGHTPVWTALRAGNVAVTRLLLGPAGRAKVDLVSGGHDSYSTAGRSGMLQWACIHAALELVEAVVRLGGADVEMDIPNLYGTPLQSVCHRLTAASAQLSSPWTTGDATTVDDITPLAAEIIRLIKLLLEKGAELNPPGPSKGALGYAINAACLGAPFGVVRFLICDRSARVDVRDEPAWRTPLHLACYRDARFVDAVLSGHAAQARFSRANLEPKDTAISPRIADQEEVEEQGGKEGVAVQEHDDVEIAKLLSTSKDVTGRLPLHYAAASGKPDLVCHILDKLGIVRPEATVIGTEPAAAGTADLRSVVNSQDAQGWTPLHWAARTGRIWLNNRDGDDSQGVKDYAAVVRLLINRGADPGSATAQGPARRRPHHMWTPLDVARYNNAPKDVLDALAVPTATGTGRSNLVRRKSNLRPGRERSNTYCDCCFLAAVGTAFLCTGCEDYVLCFTCHGSCDKLHPPPHGSFIDMSFDDSSDDDEDTDTNAQDEEAGPPNDTGRRSDSPGSEGPIGDRPEDTVASESGSPPAPAIDIDWRWEVEDSGDIILQTSDTL